MGQKYGDINHAEVASRLREAMKREGVGVRELHRRLSELIESKGEGAPRGASYGSIRAYIEGSTRKPRLSTLKLIAEVLGVREEWLIWDEGERTAALQRLAMAGRGELPDPGEEDFIAVLMDRLFPEWESLPTEGQVMVTQVFEQFFESCPPEWFDDEGNLLKEAEWDLDVLLIGLRQFVVSPLRMWRGEIDWRNRRVIEYLRVAIGAYAMAIPDRIENHPTHPYIDGSDFHA